MSFAALSQDFLFNPVTVIADENPQLVVKILHIHVDIAGPGMVKCIDQRFTTEAVDFIAYKWVQWPWLAFNNNTKIMRLRGGKFLLDSGKCLFETKRVAAIRAQSTDSVPALLYDLTHHFVDMVQGRYGRRVRGQVINRDMKLHRGAEKSLQQRVVQFLSDTRALRKSLFKAQIQLPGQLAHSQSIKDQYCNHESQDARYLKPRFPPEYRLAIHDCYCGNPVVLIRQRVHPGRRKIVRFD
jgi:hypothetical protein